MNLEIDAKLSTLCLIDELVLYFHVTERSLESERVDF